MRRITCYLKPHRLEAVKSAIAATGVSGLTVTDVRGRGDSPGPDGGPVWQGVVSLPIRSRIEVVAPLDLVDEVIQAILDSGRTGEEDDGKIFIEPVEDVYRVRTEERGEAAL